MKMVVKRFAEKIRELRKKKGLSQEKLAERSKIHFTYLNDIELGRRNPTLKTINKIAQGLKLPMWEILMEMENYHSRPSVNQLKKKKLCREDRPRKKTPTPEAPDKARRKP